VVILIVLRSIARSLWITTGNAFGLSKFPHNLPSQSWEDASLFHCGGFRNSGYAGKQTHRLNQAADLISTMASIPPLTFTATFGNCF
jgi:hypothetical protein